MVYTKQTWANGAVGGTPLSAARLNHIEDGIEAAALVTVIDVTLPPYDVDNTGATDAAAGIQDALDAAGTAGGGQVYMPSGDYLIESTTLVVPSGVTLCGDGPDTNLLQAIWPTPSGAGVTGGTSMLNTAGTISAKITCSGVAFGVSVITGITSTAGMVAGDWLMLGSTNTYWSGYPTRYKGELVRIASVDSGTQVTIDGITRDQYTSSPGVFRVTMTENVTIRDFAITNTEPGTTHATSMVGILYSHNVRVADLYLSYSDYTGVKVTSSATVLVQDCNMREFTDNSPDGQWGYGVMAECGVDGMIVAKNQFDRLRHGFTTGGIAGQYGGPHGVVVSDNYATRMTNTGFDTHQIGAGILFVGNNVNGCQNAGYTSRSLDTSFVGNKASWCTAGIYVYGVSDGIANGNVLIGNQLRHCYNEDGIILVDADAVTVKGNLIDSVAGAGIWIIGDGNDHVIEENSIYNSALVSGSRKAGIEFKSTVTSSGHLIKNNYFRNKAITGEVGTTGGMTYAIENKSAAVTSSVWIGNTCKDMVTSTIRDLSTGNADIRNINLNALTRDLPDGGHQITGRAECIPRWAATASVNLTSGTMLLGYLTPEADITAVNLTVYAASTASAVLTLGRLGLYSVASNGDITLVQGSTSDTALLGVANTKNTKAITAAGSRRGVRYAVGILTVGATAGSVRGASGIADLTGDTVYMARAVTGQTDLPASVANASITTSGNIPYVGVST